MVVRSVLVFGAAALAEIAGAMLVAGFRLDRFDLLGVGVCLLGVAIIMYAPRPGV